MKFELLDRYMRRFELERQYSFPPEMYVVVQLEGYRFSQINERVDELQGPYSEELHRVLVESARYLMEGEISVLYSYIFDEELSFLLPKSMDNLGRSARKVTSYFTGQASGKCSLLFQRVVSFSARIFQLPNIECVVDYFLWRLEEANRRLLHRYGRFVLEKKGLSRAQAAKELQLMDIRGKEKLLKNAGIELCKLPFWQRAGSAIFWQPYEHEGYNPKLDKKIKTWRKRLYVDTGFPIRKSEYRQYLLDRLKH
ncbi:MAG: hypothetical protein D6805_03320 [Planctomycetota bacterium]|nr:MAG: hypothetical protein D6805_03320 [Planctomycetota bacterium]